MSKQDRFLYRKYGNPWRDDPEIKNRNRYRARCSKCSTYVEKGEGQLKKTLTGWEVTHRECPR